MSEKWVEISLTLLFWIILGLGILEYLFRCTSFLFGFAFMIYLLVLLFMVVAMFGLAVKTPEVLTVESGVNALLWPFGDDAKIIADTTDHNAFETLFE